MTALLRRLFGRSGATSSAPAFTERLHCPYGFHKTRCHFCGSCQCWLHDDHPYIPRSFGKGRTPEEVAATLALIDAVMAKRADAELAQRLGP